MRICTPHRFYDGSFLLPVRRDTELPKVLDAGFSKVEELKGAEIAGLAPWIVWSAVNQSTYAYGLRIHAAAVSNSAAVK